MLRSGRGARAFRPRFLAWTANALVLLALVAAGSARADTIDFETLINGQEADVQLGNVLISALPSGQNLGPAIFDSRNPGPNAGGSDADLLVNKGNILILQDPDNPGQTSPGIFDIPDDAENGGTLIFDFVVATELESVVLVDINGGGQSADLTLIDAAGKQRRYHVPGEWTFDVSEEGPNGFKTLDLTTLAPQEGERAGIFATVTLEDAGFDPASVVRLEVAFASSAGLDDLKFNPSDGCSCPDITTLLYGVDPNGTIQRFRFHTGTPASVPAPGDAASAASGLAVATSSRAFWTNGQGTGQIIAFNPLTGATLPGPFPRAAPGGPGSDGLALVATGLLAVLNPAEERIYKMSSQLGTTLGFIPAPGVVGALAGGNGRLFAQVASGNIVELAPSDGTLLRSYPVPDLDGNGTPEPLSGLAFDGTHLFAATAGAAPPDVMALDPDTGELVAVSPYAAPSGALGALGAVAEPATAVCTAASIALDTDGDGIRDFCDNCPGEANADQANVDFDAFGDVCDLCPDEDQGGDETDTDGDGVGDFCDNCPIDFNPDQTTEPCGTTILQVLPGQTAIPEAPPGGGQATTQGLPASCGANITTLQLRLVCGPNTIDEAAFGLVVGTGILPECADFGGGCTETSCVGATAIGPTVIPADSSARGPGLTTPAGVRADTLYFQVKGAPLCSAAQVVDLATVEIATGATGVLPPTTDDGLDDLGFDGVVTDTGTVLPKERVAVETGSLDPTVTVQIRPALGSTTDDRWEILLSSSIEVYQATVGVSAFEGVTPAEISFGGCLNFTGNGTERSCPDPGAVAAGADLGPTLDFTGTRTVGPDANGVLYVVATGKEPVVDAELPALNPMPVDATGEPVPVLLGVVQFSDANTQPGLTFLDINTVPGFRSAFIDAFDFDVPAADAAFATAFESSDDTDVDGIAQDVDNCPFEPNFLQLDDGRLLSATADGIGNKCQCGEGNGDGSIFQIDTQVVQEDLAGLPVDPDAAQRLSVGQGTAVSIRDAAIHARATAGLPGPAIQQVCEAAVPSAP